jgi:hypothetical protein
MGMAYHRVRDAAHQSPAYPSKAPAAHDYQANAQFLSHRATISVSGSPVLR